MVVLLGHFLRMMLLRLLFICSISLLMSPLRLWMLFLRVSIQVSYLGIYWISHVENKLMQIFHSSAISYRL